jgi:chemotaxis protein histidine kinase CheA
VAIEKAMPIPVMEAPGLESSEALDLEASTLDLPFSISDIPASTIQVEPEMVKGDNAENNAFQDLEELFGSVDQGDRPISTEPPEPSAHRYIDQYIRGNQSLVTRLAHRLQDSNPQTAPTLSNTIRVDLDRLERLNNLVGELVTQENGSILQNQQFQTMLGALLKRFSRFEQITRDLQDILDRSQSDRARLDAPAQSDNSSGFDALQMDSYSGAHLLMQETVEEIAQL